MRLRAPLCLGLLACTLAAQDADPLAWIPRRASMAIVLNRPMQALGRWDRLAERLKSKEMSAVRKALAEDFGGLPLLEPEAPLVAFMVPGPPAKAARGQEGAPAAPKSKNLEFRVLAIGKKESFQARFKPADMAKAHSGFSTAIVQGKAVVVALRGRIAVLGPKDSGPMLAALLADKARFALPPAPERAWAASQDMAFFVSRESLKREPKAKPAATQGGWSPFDKLSEALSRNPEREVASLVMGLRLAENGDLTGALRLGVAPGGELARLTAGLEKGGGPAFRGLPAAPFALAFGMEIPSAWAASMAQSAAEDAAQDSKSDAAAVAALQRLFRELRGFGLVLRGAKPGAPPASGLGLALLVENAKAFMTQAAILAARPGKDGSLGMRTASSTFQGRAVATFTRVPPEPKPTEGEPEGPSMMPPPEALFGSKEVKSSLLMADDHTLIAGFGDPAEAFQAGLDSLAKGGLGQLARLQRTRDLLSPDGAPGQGVLYLDLPETLALVGAFLPLPLPEADLKKPTPPLGLAFKVGAERIELNLAVPTEALDLIGRLAASAAEMRKAPKE